MLSSTFHLHDLHAVLNLVPVLTQKSQGMRVVRTFCSSTAKTSTVTFIFYFIILMTTILPFNKKSIDKICVQYFGHSMIFHDQWRRKLYHILLGHGSGRHFDLVGSYAYTPLACYVTLPFKWFGGQCNSQKNLCVEGYCFVFNMVLLTSKS